MQRLTTRAKMTFQFSLVTILTLLITGVIFSIGYYISSRIEIRKNLLHEINEVISQHLYVEKGRLILKRGEENELLSEHLRNDGTSAVIYNSEFEPLATYGMFKKYDSEDYNKKNKIALENVFKTGEYFIYTDGKSYGNRPYELVIYPVSSNGGVVGLVQLAIEVQLANDIVKLSVMILLGALLIGATISFIASYFISKQALSPLTVLSQQMNDISTSNLDLKIDTSGNEKDEMVVLSRTFNRMLERINEGVLKQKEFISTASHELRTPLTRAVSNLEVILLDLKEQSARKSIRRTKEELLNLNSILESLLALSNIKELKKVSEEVKVREEIDIMLKNFALDIKRKRLRIENKVKDTTINIPKNYFYVIFNNLLSNAIKYSRKEGIINISCEVKKDRCGIKISDSGVGIRSRDLGQIFERFYRGRNAKGNGYGVGLALVKEVCNKLGLDISVISGEGKGSEFIVSGLETV